MGESVYVREVTGMFMHQRPNLQQKFSQQVQMAEKAWNLAAPALEPLLAFAKRK